MRDVPGYEGLYSVTEDGCIWSHDRVVTGPKLTKEIKGRWLRPGRANNGYPTVSLGKAGVSRTWKVARLVALAWIPNPQSLPVINHLNGNKADSRAVNLEWCTSSQNNRHAMETGLKRRSTPRKDIAMRSLGIASRKLTQEQIQEVFALRAGGMLQRDIGARFGVGQDVVSRILSGETYQSF
jgi:hypothetical protein